MLAKTIKSVGVVTILSMLMWASLLWLVGGARAEGAAVRQVAPDGTDAGDCIGSPCASISYAISQAVADDVIEVAAGTYTDTFTVDKNLDIIGTAGMTTTIVQAAAISTTSATPVITVTAGVTVVVDGLTVQHGYTFGWSSGIINDRGFVTVQNSTIQHNRGGGLLNSGTMVVQNSLIQGNELAFEGGGVQNSNMAQMLIHNSIVRDNTASNSGGGLVNYGGTVTVTQSIIENNAASAGMSGGGIANYNGSLLLQDSLVQGNRAGGGAGLFNSDVAEVRSSMVVSNTAVNEGGGIRHDSGTLTIHNSTIGYNTVEDDTFVGSGGGLALFTFFTSSVTIENSTISHNSVTGSGGGIYFSHGYTTTSEMVINHSTIAHNTADADADGGDGGGLWHSGGSLLLQNTVVAANTAGSGGAPDCWGEIASADYNLLGEDTGCIFTAQAHDMVGSSGSAIDPLLAALADNGGATWTHALLPDSPARDLIPPTEGGCGTTFTQDQRGVARPQAAGCDVGAFEVEMETHLLFLPFVSRALD